MIAVAVGLPHDLQSDADRRQGIAELVGEHGQELVLAPIGLGQGRRPPLQLGDQPGAIVRQGFQLAALILDLAAHDPLEDHGPDRLPEAVAVEALEQEVQDPLLHRLDGHRHVAVAREQDDGDIVPVELGPEAVEEFQAVEVRELVVEQDAVGPDIAAHPQAVLARAGLPEPVVSLVALGDPAAIDRAILGIVLDDENPVRSIDHVGITPSWAGSPPRTSNP